MQFHSLTGQFSPELCATAPRYTAFKALNFEHLFGAKFEVLSVLQLYSQDKIAGRLAVLNDGEIQIVPKRMIAKPTGI